MSAPDFGALVAQTLAELTPDAAVEAAADLDGSGADGPDDVIDFVMAGLSERVADFRAAGVRAQSEARTELRAYLTTAALLLASAAAEMDRHAAETGFCRKGREPFTVDDVRPCGECEATAEVMVDEANAVCLACYRRLHADGCGCPAPIAPDSPPKSQLFFVYEARRRNGGSFEDAVRASVEPYRAYLAAKEGAS